MKAHHIPALKMPSTTEQPVEKNVIIKGSRYKILFIHECLNRICNFYALSSKSFILSESGEYNSHYE